MQITIADRGAGIPAADQQQLFKPFFRASNAAKITANGVGLGLYIARSLSFEGVEYAPLRHPLTDDELLDVVAKQAKQRRESVEQFAAAGRTDLVDKEERELVVLLDYMPAPLSDAELDEAVRAAVAELDARSMKDMGRVVQSVLAAHKGRVDGKRVSVAVKARLAS